MMRIEPNRPGYVGYACDGLLYTIPNPMDCTENMYTKLPARIEGFVGSVPYENLSALESNEHLEEIDKPCGVFFDPFTGAFVNLYQAYIDEDLDDYIKDACYTKSTDKYGLGYTPPKPLIRTLTCMPDNNPAPVKPTYPCPRDPWLPTIFLTVTGSDSTLRGIRWCGEVWQLPYDSGYRKEVCPTNYRRVLRQRVRDSGIIYFTNAEEWEMKNRLGAGSALRLQFRQLKREQYGVPFEKATATHLIQLVFENEESKKDLVVFKDFFTGSDHTDVRCDLGVYCDKPSIDFYNYRIREEQFGSYTDEDGITYKWEKGSGWR